MTVTSIQGLICKELKRQNKLPEKWNELILEPSRPRIPESLVLDKCVFYVDGIKNTGTSHATDKATKWKNLKGSDYATPRGTPVWYDDHVRVSNSTSDCFYFNPSISDLKKNFTIEAVFSTVYPPDNSRNDVISGNHWAAGYRLYISTSGKLAFSTCKISSSDSTYEQIYGTETVVPGKPIYACFRMNSSGIKSVYSSLGDEVVATTATSVAGGLVSEHSMYLGKSAQGFGSRKAIDIYAFRMHSRCLTDEEVASNMLYDQDRYNFLY